MPFFQSMAVRFGVKSLLENCGVDEESAGWLAAGASLATALVTADLHGHIAGEAVAQGVHHAAGHAVLSHGSNHVVSHGLNHVVSNSSSHIVGQSTDHVLHNGHNMSHLARTGHSELELNHAGYKEGTSVYITHDNWHEDHWGTIEDFSVSEPEHPDMVQIKIGTDSNNTHNGEWVSESQIHLKKPY